MDNTAYSISFILYGLAFCYILVSLFLKYTRHRLLLIKAGLIKMPSSINSFEFINEVFQNMGISGVIWIWSPIYYHSKNIGRNNKSICVLAMEKKLKKIRLFQILSSSYILLFFIVYF